MEGVNYFKMKILDNNNQEISLHEALKLLEKYDQFEEMNRLIHQVVDKSHVRGSAYSHDYDAVIEKHNKEVFDDSYIDQLLKFPTKKRALITESRELGPELGDIAYLKIKLRNSTFDKKKNIFEGYERRPVLILSIDKDKVNGLEVTHTNTFRGLSLIPLGRLDKNDVRESFLNIYTYGDYKGLPCEYDFPFAFNSEGKAMTKYELQKERFGKIYPDKGGKSPFLIRFDYSKNYLTKLSEDQTNQILSTLKDYIEHESGLK